MALVKPLHNDINFLRLKPILLFLQGLNFKHAVWQKLGVLETDDTLSVVRYSQRLNMELDLRSLFGLQCTAVLIVPDPATPPSPRI